METHQIKNTILESLKGGIQVQKIPRKKIALEMAVRGINPENYDDWLQFRKNGHGVAFWEPGGKD